MAKKWAEDEDVAKAPTCRNGIRQPETQDYGFQAAFLFDVKRTLGMDTARCRFCGMCLCDLRISGCRNLRRVGTRCPRGFRLPWGRRVGSKCPPYAAAFVGWVQRGGVNGMPVCGWAYARALSIGRQPETGKCGFRLPCLPLRAAAVFPPTPCPRLRKCSCSAPCRTWGWTPARRNVRG